MNPRDNEREFGAMLRRGLASGAAATEAECLDAAMLAAYYERSLSADEIRACDLHVSNCAHCRSQLAALARAEPEREGEGSRGWSWIWDWRLLVPVTAALTIFIAWVSVRQSFVAPQNRVAPTVAQNRDQAPVTEAPSASQAQPQFPATAAQRASPSADLTREPAAAEKKNAGAPSSKSGAGAAADKLERRTDATSQNELRKLQANAKPRSESNEEGGKEKDRRGGERMRGGVSDGIGRGASGQASGTGAGIAGGAAPQPAPPPAAAAPGESADRKTAQLDSDQSAAKREPGAAAAGAPAPAQGAPPQSESGKTQNAPAHAGGNLGGNAQGLTKSATEKQKSAEPETQALNVNSRFKQDESKPIMIPTPDGSTLWRVAGFAAAQEIQMSRDVGATWQRQLTEPELILTAGSAPTAKVCWVVGRRGTILRTADGENWQRIKSPTTADLASVTATDADTAKITAADGAEFSTKDGGATWARTKKPR